MGVEEGVGGGGRGGGGVKRFHVEHTEAMTLVCVVSKCYDTVAWV